MVSWPAPGRGRRMWYPPRAVPAPGAAARCLAGVPRWSPAPRPSAGEAPHWVRHARVAVHRRSAPLARTQHRCWKDPRSSAPFSLSRVRCGRRRSRRRRIARRSGNPAAGGLATATGESVFHRTPPAFPLPLPTGPPAATQGSRRSGARWPRSSGTCDPGPAAAPVLGYPGWRETRVIPFVRPPAPPSGAMSLRFAPPSATRPLRTIGSHPESTSRARRLRPFPRTPPFRLNVPPLPSRWPHHPPTRHRPSLNGGPTVGTRDLGEQQQVVRAAEADPHHIHGGSLSLPHQFHVFRRHVSARILRASCRFRTGCVSAWRRRQRRRPRG